MILGPMNFPQFLDTEFHQNIYIVRHFVCDHVMN